MFRGLKNSCGCFGSVSLPAGSISHLLLCLMVFSLSVGLLLYRISFDKFRQQVIKKIASITLICGFVIICGMVLLGNFRKSMLAMSLFGRKYYGRELSELIPELVDVSTNKTFKSSQIIGNRVIILGVFDLNCQRCIKAIESLDRLYKDTSRTGHIPIIALVNTYSKAHLKFFNTRYRIKLPTYFPKPNEFSNNREQETFLSEKAVYLVKDNRIINSGWPSSNKDWKDFLKEAEEVQRKGEMKILSAGNKRETNNGEKIRFVVMDTIGCKDCNRPYEIFANIRDINTGPGDSLYVLDSVYREVRIFDAQGTYSRTITLPDVIERPSSVAAIPDGSLYIVNQLYWTNARVYRLNSSGQIIGSFGLHFTPWRVRWCQDALFINSFPYYGNETKWLIHKFSPDGKLLGEFCHRRPNWHEERRPVGGMNGFLAVSNDQIFFAFGFPYDVRSFSPAGDSLSSFERLPSFYKNKFRKKAEGENAPTLKWWGGFTEGLVVVSNDRYMIVLICNSKEQKTIVDIWAIGKRQFLGSVDPKNITLRPHLKCTVPAANQEFYIVLYYPYPHILRLRLVIS